MKIYVAYIQGIDLVYNDVLGVYTTPEDARKAAIDDIERGAEESFDRDGVIVDYDNLSIYFDEWEFGYKYQIKEYEVA